MENKIELRCPILTAMTLNIPFEVDNETEEKYTSDPRAIHMLRQSLLVYVNWPEDSFGKEFKAAHYDVTVIKFSADDLIRADSKSVRVENFGYSNYMNRVWVSPQAVSELGEEAVLKDLPRAIKKLLFFEELLQFTLDNSDSIF
ncbi:MAG: hypothetical protein ABIO57_03775 [Candidatus Paceibacterota bacterium]